MALSHEEIREIAQCVAREITVELQAAEEQIELSNQLVSGLISPGAIPVNGREHRKEPCKACRIDPNGPLEAGNVMATTKDAIGTLNKEEVENWCSELIEVHDGRCTRAEQIRQAAAECKAKYPDDTDAYFACFIPAFREKTGRAQ